MKQEEGNTLRSCQGVIDRHTGQQIDTLTSTQLFVFHVNHVTGELYLNVV